MINKKSKIYFHVNKITSFESKLMITIDMVNRLTEKREKLHPLTHTSVHIKNETQKPTTNQQN